MGLLWGLVLSGLERGESIIAQIVIYQGHFATVKVEELRLGTYEDVVEDLVVIEDEFGVRILTLVIE